MTLHLVVGDITDQRVDVIVNAANSSLLGGGGVDGAIHRRGGPQILAQCRALRVSVCKHGLPPGSAVATTAGDLPAQWVIHTVGPIFAPGEDRSATLRSCYSTSLKIAYALGARSIAFPLISAGAYAWPKQDAVRQAIQGIRAGESADDGVGACGRGADGAGGGSAQSGLDVRLVLFDEQTAQIARRVLVAMSSDC